MADKFEDLRTFVTVVSCGGINSAAAEIGIAKSAVSRRLSDLEARLGVTLIARTTRRFETTAIGRDYFRRAGEILAALDQLDADPSGTGAHEAITIAASHDVLTHTVAPSLPEFLSSHPGVSIRLVASGGDADVTISTSPSNGTASRTVATDTLALCASPAYLDRRGTPADVADLTDHAGIVVGDAAAWTFAAGAHRPARHAIRAPDIDVAVALAAAGLGIAQVPATAIREELRSGRLVTVLQGSEPPAHPVFAIVADDAPLAAKAFADHLASTSTAAG